MSEYVPDPHAYAYAMWSHGGKRFIAEVYKQEQGWRLKTGRGKRMVDSGTFVNSKSLIKFVAVKAADVCPNVDPVVNTLNRIKNRDPSSLIPDCFEHAGVRVEGPGGRGLPACVSCPYRLKCGEPSAYSAEPVPEAEESEEVLFARIQAKLKAGKCGPSNGR